MNYNLSDYFVLSSSCLITKGYNRSLIHDFSRNSSNLISNEYFDLIEYLDRKKIEEIITEVEDDSKNFFFEFLNFMFDNEYALFVNDIELFPAKSDELYDSHVVLKDCNTFNKMYQFVIILSINVYKKLCCQYILLGYVTVFEE
jgi:hypothetical protein